MLANNLLKHNIDTLLNARGQTRRDLAEWCHRTESWISKIFRNAEREIPLKYVDRIADFFGVATYQLFQPGISGLTERRQRTRRATTDRRIGQARRAMLAAAAEVERVRPSASRKQGHDEAAPADLPVPLYDFIDRFAKEANAALAQANSRRQTAVARDPKSQSRPVHRGGRGPDDRPIKGKPA